MCRVLDEYEVEGRWERLRWRRLWRRMFAAEYSVVKRIRAAKKAKEMRKEQTGRGRRGRAVEIEEGEE